MVGSVYDSFFGECLKCSEIYDCDVCDQDGCVVCDDKSAPLAGKCVIV